MLGAGVGDRQHGLLDILLSLADKPREIGFVTGEKGLEVRFERFAEIRQQAVDHHRQNVGPVGLGHFQCGADARA